MDSHIIVKATDPTFVPPENLAPGKLKHSYYTREAISNAIIAHVTRSRSDYTEIQRRGLARLYHEGSWNMGDMHSIDNLWKWFEIFNDVFFGGILTDICEVEWMSCKHDRPNMNFGSKIQCSHSCGVWPGFELDPRYHIARPRITIYIARHSSREGILECVHDYLGGLLQEMLRAVFLYYQAYPHEGWPWSNPQVAAKEDPWGGYDLHWYAAAAAIEPIDGNKDVRSPNRILNGIGFGIPTEAAWKMANAMQRGKNLPPAWELERFGIDIFWVRQFLEAARQLDREQEVTRFRAERLDKLNVCTGVGWIDAVEKGGFVC